METKKSGANLLRYILIAAVVVAIIGLAGLGVVYLTGGSGEASEAISAPTLSSADSANPEVATFSIVPSESQVQFSLDEELMNQPTHVVGTTDQVAGEIAVDFANPAQSQIGVIRINVRTLQTDRESRNRAIRSFILQSADDRYEFAQFTPTALSGLPESITMGTPFTFQITGDLQIRDITQSVTFDATVTPESEDRISGSAQVTVTRTQFNLQIPNAPGVANVTDNVLLEINFVATRVTADSAATAESAG